jgi:hypothetical protein
MAHRIGAIVCMLVAAACSSSGPATSDAGTEPDANGVLAVDAGPDLTIHLPVTQVSLMAVTSGTQATGATVSWQQTAGAPAVLAGETTSALSVSGLAVGVYRFQVTATSTAGQTATDEVTVTVASDATLCDGPIYHVSPGGDDGNDGSEGAPFATLAHATATITIPGSTIRLAAGEYLEIEVSELAPGVCLEGAGDSTVIKSTLSADWTPIIRAASPMGTDGHQHISHLKLDGQDLTTFWAIEVSGRSNVSIHDITVVDFADRGVLIGGRDDNQEGAPAIYATGLSFYNNTILNSAAYDTPNGVYGRGCLNVGGTEGMRIYDNVITQNQRPEGYNGWPIKYLGGGYNKGLKIFDNVLTKIPFTGAYPGENGWDFMVEMFYDQGTEFYGNVVNGAGYDANHNSRGDYPYGLWIHDNVFSIPEVVNSYNSAVTLEFSSDGVIVENNVIRNMSGCVLFTPRPGSVISDVTIAGNLCTNVSKGDGDGSNAYFINTHAGQDDYSIDGLYIYNNTFLADPANRPWWGIELGGQSTGTTRNVRIQNNILAYTVTGAIVQGSASPADDVQITNNDIFDNEQSNDPVWQGAQPTNYVYQDNIHVDPLFVSPTDFSLQDGSPAIDTGVDVGRPFLGAAPDMGALER